MTEFILILSDTLGSASFIVGMQATAIGAPSTLPRSQKTREARAKSHYYGNYFIFVYVIESI